MRANYHQLEPRLWYPMFSKPMTSEQLIAELG
jgi:hypothetical protein